uniref:Helicase C-terminal domain-containing protein n=1 Tax=Rhabditophanes sp. KR3021 TaxID=114890 RepID=A0AC35UBY4_9BILA
MREEKIESVVPKSLQEMIDGLPELHEKVMLLMRGAIRENITDYALDESIFRIKEAKKTFDKTLVSFCSIAKKSQKNRAPVIGNVPAEEIMDEVDDEIISDNDEYSDIYSSNANMGSLLKESPRSTIMDVMLAFKNLASINQTNVVESVLNTQKEVSSSNSMAGNSNVPTESVILEDKTDDSILNDNAFNDSSDEEIDFFNEEPDILGDFISGRLKETEVTEITNGAVKYTLQEDRVVSESGVNIAIITPETSVGNIKPKSPIASGLTESLVGSKIINTNQAVQGTNAIQEFSVDENISNANNDPPTTIEDVQSSMPSESNICEEKELYSNTLVNLVDTISSMTESSSDEFTTDPSVISKLFETRTASQEENVNEDMKNLSDMDVSSDESIKYASKNKTSVFLSSDSEDEAQLESVEELENELMDADGIKKETDSRKRKSLSKSNITSKRLRTRSNAEESYIEEILISSDDELLPDPLNCVRKNQRRILTDAELDQSTKEAMKNDKQKRLAFGEHIKQRAKIADCFEDVESYFKPEDEFDISLSSKLLFLIELLKQAETVGDKVLVFFNYNFTLNYVVKILEHLMATDQWYSEAHPLPLGRRKRYGWRLHHDYAIINGKTSAIDRSLIQESFNNPNLPRKRLIFLITRAGGIGMNMVGFNRAVLFESNSNPALDSQALHRIYRINQRKPSFFYRLIVDRSIEKIIHQEQIKKESTSLRTIDKRNIRAASNSDKADWYTFTPKLDDSTVQPILQVPKDDAFARIMLANRDIIVNYVPKDLLLQNRAEEALTEAEIETEWKKYEEENERIEDEKKAHAEYIRKNPTTNNQQNGLPSRLEKSAPISTGQANLNIRNILNALANNQRSGLVNASAHDRQNSGMNLPVNSGSANINLNTNITRVSGNPILNTANQPSTASSNQNINRPANSARSYSKVGYNSVPHIANGKSPHSVHPITNGRPPNSVINAPTYSRSMILQDPNVRYLGSRHQLSNAPVLRNTLTHPSISAKTSTNGTQIGYDPKNRYMNKNSLLPTNDLQQKK